MRRYPRNDVENESRMVGVTIPALKTTGTNNTLTGTKSLSRARTIVITPAGQCSPVIEETNEQNEEEGKQTELPTTSSPFGRVRGLIKYLFVQAMIWLKGQGKEKKVDTTEDVLARYHNLYLYGTVPLTIKVRTAIRSGTLGHILQYMEFVAAVVSVICYVRSTYTREQHHWVLTLRRIFGIFFAADFILKLYSAPVRLHYIFSFNGFVDLASTLSIISLWSIKLEKDGAIPQMLLVVRALRILPFLVSFGIFGGTIAQQIFLLTVYTLGGVFIAAGLLQWVEYRATSDKTKQEEGCGPSGCFNFYDAFYFIVVTIATVGYGDFTPKSSLGRLVTLGVILAAVLILPQQINKILQVASRRPYGGDYAVRKAVGTNFVVVSGNVSFQTIRHFLFGFYHPNHDKDMAAFPIRVVIMSPSKPSYEMKTLLTHYRNQVEFIEGTPLRESDLDRVCAHHATAFFLLADERAKDFDAEDTAQITRALSVHRHCGQTIRVIVELLRPENYISAIWDEAEAGVEIICPEAVRFQLLARSCHIKGFSTFIINLFRSGLLLRNPNPDHWMTEYYDGLRQKIFPVILPVCFHKEELSFEVAAEIVYLKYHVILIGLDILLENNTRVVRLYPRGRTIQKGDLGLVIARDLQTAERISKYGIKNTSKDDQGFLRDIKESRRDMEMGIISSRKNESNGSFESCKDSSGISSKPGRTAHLQGKLKQFYSLSEKEAAQQHENSKLKFVSSLEEAIDMAMSWPPLTRWDKPERPVLERKQEAILQNLTDSTMNVVTLPSPHVLLCIEGKWPLNLFYFISSLRVPNMPKMPVVIMHPNRPSAPEWGCVGLFDDVYFVKGSALYELDLVRAGVFHAEKVVILTQGIEDESRPIDDNEDMVSTLDVKNIVITANVERLLSPARDRVLVELMQENQLQFLRPHIKMEAIQFEPETFQRDRDAQLQFAPPFAEGKGLCPSAFTFLMYATFFNRNTVLIIEQLSCGRQIGEEEEGGSSTRNLQQIPIPNCYIGLSFGELFQALLHNEKALALGVYRVAGTHGSVVSYVCTNPASTTEMLPGDMIYILQ